MNLTLEDFAGRWRLTRRIDDRHGGQSGHLTGEARLTPISEGLVYDERGAVQFGAGPVLQAERRYLWSDANGLIVVRFADGGDFHSFRPAGRVDGTDHPCGEDFYRVRYDFDHWPDWQAVWTVSGPRKDYTMISDYSRP